LHCLSNRKGITPSLLFCVAVTHYQMPGMIWPVRA
jgi:hypothetical protein